MAGPAFHPDDLSEVIGPAEAFDPGHGSTPNTYALQHHLALEVVAHLEQEDVPFWFRGGTALHTRLPERTRFSSDVDVSTADAAALHDALRAFTKRFPNSGIELQEPPKDLRVAGVQHRLDFGHSKDGADGAPVRVLVEVVEIDEPADRFEALRLQGDGHDWGVDVLAPTYETFMGQKLAVLGPTTVGKHARPSSPSRTPPSTTNLAAAPSGGRGSASAAVSGKASPLLKCASPRGARTTASGTSWKEAWTGATPGCRPPRARHGPRGPVQANPKRSSRPTTASEPSGGVREAWARPEP